MKVHKNRSVCARTHHSGVPRRVGNVLNGRFDVCVEPEQVGRVITILEFHQPRVIRSVVSTCLVLGIDVEVCIETGHVGLQRIVVFSHRRNPCLVLRRIV